MKNKILATIGLSILSVSSASATLIAYEDFNGLSNGTNLTGSNGGFGWSSAWLDNDGSQASPLITDGVATWNSSIDSNRRNISTISSGTVWLRGTVNLNSGRFGDEKFGLYATDGSRVHITDDSTNEYAIARSSTNANLGQTIVLGAPANAGTFIYIFKVDLDSANKTVTYWRNPDLATFNGTGGNSTNSSMINVAGLTLSAGPGSTFDNILIGTTAASIIPEPSAALLGGLGVLALLRRRRA